MTHSLSLYICVQAVFEKFVIRQIGSTNLFCMVFSCQNTLYGFTFLDGWNRRYWTYACCFQNMRYNFYWIIIFSECCFVFFVYLHVFFCFREQQNRKRTEHLLCFACTREKTCHSCVYAKLEASGNLSNLDESKMTYVHKREWTTRAPFIIVRNALL